MAIEDICKIPPPPPPPPGDGANGGEGNQPGPDDGDGIPEVIPQRIEAGQAPYPQPYRPVGNQNQGELGNDHIPRPGTTPRFAAASREITTIPSQFFLSQNFNTQLVYERLQMHKPENERGKRSPFHGSVWFTNHRPNPQPDNVSDDADLFRWSQMSIWSSDNNSEKFFMPALVFGPNISQLGLLGLFFANNFDEYVALLERLGIEYRDAPIAVLRPNNPVGIISDMPNWPEAPIFTVSPIGPGSGLNITPNYTLENAINNQGDMQTTETLWFSLINRGLAGSDGIPGFTVNNRLTLAGEKFIDNMFPSAIKNSNQLSEKQKYDMFLEVFLNGKESGQWDQFTSLPGSLSSTADYFRTPNITRDAPYLDYVFDAPVAFFEEELNDILLSPFHSAKIKVQIDNVENLVSGRFDNVHQIPNLYYYYNFLEIEKKYAKPGGRLTRDNIRDVVPEGESDYVITTLSIIDEYRMHGRIRKNELTTPRTLKFPSDRVKNLPQVNEFIKKYAVNFVEITINTKQGGPINAMLQRNKMDRVVLEKMAPSYNSINEGAPSEFFGIGILNPTLTNSSTYVLDDSFLEVEEGGNQNSILNTINDRTESFIHTKMVPGFFKNLKEDILFAEGLELQRVDEYSYPLRYTHCEDKNLLKLEESIRSQIFMSQAETFIAESSAGRNYANILEGKKAYSEVVGYKVSKFQWDKESKTYSDQPVQELYFMDSDEVETISYVDTQVLPFTKYKYSIETINLVLATEYRYTGVTIDSPQFQISVRSTLEPLLITAPFYEEVVDVIDHPPLAPQVNFLPYQGVDDRFGILLTSNYGEVKEKRISLNPANDNFDFGEVLYKTDSLPSAFQWLRLDRAPEKYSDFFYSEGDFVEANNKTGFTIQDIQPNKYYYYIFRAWDNMDIENPDYSKALSSNPTDVFRVRIVSYENGIFMEVEVYDMFEKRKEVKVGFERLLKVQPSFKQTLINFKQAFDEIYNSGRITIPENSLTNLRKRLNLISNENRNFVADEFEFQKAAPDIELVSIGTAPSNSDNYIWNKRYKLRIKSKNSGKAIDLNIKFVQEKRILSNNDDNGPPESEYEVILGPGERIEENNGNLYIVFGDDNDPSDGGPYT